MFSNRISSHYTWLGDNNYHFQANVTNLITVYKVVKLQKLNMKTKTRGQINSVECQEEKALHFCYDTSYFSCLYYFLFIRFLCSSSDCNHTQLQKKNILQQTDEKRILLLIRPDRRFCDDNQPCTFLFMEGKHTHTHTFYRGF